MTARDLRSDALSWGGALWGQARDLGGGVLLYAGILVAVFAGTRWVRGRMRSAMVRRRIRPNVIALADNLLQIGVYLLAGSFVLGAFGNDRGSLLTAFSLTTAAISLALQDVLKNFAAGVFLLAEEPFRAGDWIASGGFEGEVERVDVRMTTVRNERGQQVIIPNFLLFSQVVINHSAYRRRFALVTLTGMLAAAGDVEPLLRDVCAGIPGLAGSELAVALRGVSPGGCDGELRIALPGRSGPWPEAALLVALAERFPEATATVAAAPAVPVAPLPPVPAPPYTDAAQPRIG